MCIFLNGLFYFGIDDICCIVYKDKISMYIYIRVIFYFDSCHCVLSQSWLKIFFYFWIKVGTMRILYYLCLYRSTKLLYYYKYCPKFQKNTINNYYRTHSLWNIFYNFLWIQSIPGTKHHRQILRHRKFLIICSPATIHHKN